MKLKVATFNVENLFERIDFGGFASDRDSKRSRNYLPSSVKFLTDFENDDYSQFEDYRQLMKAAAVSLGDDKLQQTALATHLIDADIIFLQEIDSIRSLRKFHENYLAKVNRNTYKQFILHQGNDPRGIDVAALSTDKFGIKSRSYAHLTRGALWSTEEREKIVEDYPLTSSYMKKRNRIFNRDCLEIEILDKEKKLTVFVCHFKSMSGGRKETMGERLVESLAVKKIIENKFDDPRDSNWLIVGDLNDFTGQWRVRASGEEDFVEENESGISPLLDEFSENLVERLPVEERWTHYYPGKKTKSQLDYILASPKVAEENKLVLPKIIRQGLPYRVPNTDAIQRFPRIGWDRPKSSDHCPVVIEISIS